MALYKTSMAAGICLLLAGTLAVLSHFSGQLREGYATWESLLGGGGAIALGFLLVIAGDVGKRMISLERSLSSMQESKAN